MPIYKCRSILPKETAIKDIEANSPEEAANEFHFKYLNVIENAKYIKRGMNSLGGETREAICFCQVGVIGHGSWVSKVYNGGIWRRGGVKGCSIPTIEEIAKLVGYEDDPNTLLDVWPLEETEWKRG